MKSLYLDKKRFYYVNDFYSVYRIHEASITSSIKNNSKIGEIKKLNYNIRDNYFYKIKGKKKIFIDNFLISLTSFSFRVFRYFFEKITLNSKKIISDKYKN